MKEEEIRKREIFNKYLELVGEDIKELFKFTSFVEIPCPACSRNDFTYEFDKIGFNYVSCKYCSTLFANPRPPIDSLKKFYSESTSTDFFVDEFFAPVAEIRREKIFKPRAEYVHKILTKGKKLVVGDVGAGFGLFLEELRKMQPDNQYIAVEPSVKMAKICRDKKLHVMALFLEDIDGMDEQLDLLTAFELIEHLFEPVSFLKKAFSLLKPQGYLYLTTLNSKGFDILLLWAKSRSVNPPHHINFYNPSSIRYLLEGLGFEIIEISTPGKLDWDIVEGMIKNEKEDAGRFWSMLSNEGDEASKSQLQEWIAKNNLSSHMRVLARKPG